VPRGSQHFLGFPVTVREFFDEVARSVLNLSFTTPSLIDLSP
jgi:hypothetical protein